MSTQKSYRNDKSQKIWYIAVFVLLCLCSACSVQQGKIGDATLPSVTLATPDASPTTYVTPVEPALWDLLPTPTMLSPTATSGTITLCEGMDMRLVNQLCQVTTYPVSWFRWASTGEFLFYRIENRDEYWEFNVAQSLTAHILPEDALSTPNANEGLESFSLPNDADIYLVSPSQQRVIFARAQQSGPTPTPGQGESWGLTIPIYNIFVLEQGGGRPQYLGQINGWVESFTWLPMEDEILIHVSPRLPHTALLWLAGLSAHEVEPLFLTEAGESEAIFRALSPNGNLILYSKEDQLYLHNLNSGTKQKLSVPPLFGRAYYWFLTDQTLLIVDDYSQPLDFEVTVFDLDLNRFCKSYDQTLRIHSIQLSMDKLYLAIQWETTRELYIFPISNQCAGD